MSSSPKSSFVDRFSSLLPLCLRLEGDESVPARNSAPYTAPLLALIVVTASFLYFFDLTHKWYWQDEAITAFRVAGNSMVYDMDIYSDGHLHSTSELERFLKVETYPERTTKDMMRSISDMPSHPPLYFLALRFWSEQFGSSVTSQRALSALFTVLALVTFIWLGFQTLERAQAIVAGTALFAYSPVLLLYAQDARPYTMWLFLSLFCTALFFTAQKTKNVFLWASYCLATIVSLYTHSFSVFVAIGHGIYLIVTERSFTTNVKYGLTALVIAAISYLPWMFVVLEHYERLENSKPYFDRPHHNLTLYAWGVMGNLSFCYSEYFWCWPLGVAFAAVIALAFFITYKFNRKQTSLGILLLFLLNNIPLLYYDITHSALRMTVTRYQMPTLAAMNLALGSAFGWANAGPKPVKLLAWILLAAILSLETLGCYSHFKNQNGYLTASAQTRVILDALGNMKKPVIIVTPNQGGNSTALALSRVVPAYTQFLFVKGKAKPKLPAGYDEALLLEADDTIARKMYREKKYELRVLYDRPPRVLLMKPWDKQAPK